MDDGDVADDDERKWGKKEGHMRER